MIPLIYLLKTIIISGLLFTYFWIFLRNRPFHHFNRLFLVSIPLFSFLLPSLHFNMPEFWNQPVDGSPIHLLSVTQGRLDEVVTTYTERNSGIKLTWEWFALLAMLLVSIILFIRLLKEIYHLRTLRRNKIPLQLPEAKVYFVSEKGTPFSFFKSIFWGEEMELGSREGRQILRHELFHVRNKHSVDITGMEVISTLCWFNPFFHLIGRELRLIHEYAADEYAVAETDEYEYASLLLTKVIGRPLPLTNPFFKNQIKRRIAMITKPNKNKKALVGRLMILPLLALLICLFAFNLKKATLFHAAKNIKVVIDAGHGGIFPGSQINGINEKDINLAISKKIQSLSPEYYVDVIMSRETDQAPGSNELRKSLEYVAALAKNKNADLFISIHANQTENKQKTDMQTLKSGFQIYIPRNSSSIYESSVKLGSVLTEVIKSDYTIDSELKQTGDNGNNVLILREATVPAVLIECGYMDNPSDLKYLQDEKNQEKIARDILEAIKKYGSENNFSNSDKMPDKTLGYKLITEQEAQQIPEGAIQGLDIDSRNYLHLIDLKDGGKYAYKMSPEWKWAIDHPKEIEKSMNENTDDKKEILRILDSVRKVNPD